MTDIKLRHSNKLQQTTSNGKYQSKGGATKVADWGKTGGADCETGLGALAVRELVILLQTVCTTPSHTITLICGHRIQCCFIYIQYAIYHT